MLSTHVIQTLKKKLIEYKTIFPFSFPEDFKLNHERMKIKLEVSTEVQYF